jgi:hypothetical protein
MHLLNVHTLKLKSFDLRHAPKYAILSHTWGEEEVTYKDITKRPDDKTKAGWIKILRMIEIAEGHDMEWIWVDTCCIDKSSSAELSENINSMFAYYSKAQFCVAYLEDVPARSSHSGDSVGQTLPYEFAESRWFTRGWTLQELIAPVEVDFYAGDWTFIAQKSKILTEIGSITRIDAEVLVNPRLYKRTCVAHRMSWASKRVTTRAEDEAYCLMGLFEVNMPLLYGEGAENAFMRLQHEILKTSADHSLFIWTARNRGNWINRENKTFVGGFLAESPLEFVDCNNLVERPYNKTEEGRGHKEPYHMTNLGLRISLPVFRIAKRRYFALLDCELDARYPPNTKIGVCVRKTKRPDGQGFQRILERRPMFVRLGTSTNFDINSFYEINDSAMSMPERTRILEIDEKSVHNHEMYVQQRLYALDK